MGAILAWLLKLFGVWVNKTPPIVTVAKEAGAAEERVQADEAALASERAIAQAEADAPRSKGALVDRLNKGAF